MTSHELARQLLAQSDQPVMIYDTSSGKWVEVVGCSQSHEGAKVRLYSYEDD